MHALVHFMKCLFWNYRCLTPSATTHGEGRRGYDTNSSMFRNTHKKRYGHINDLTKARIDLLDVLIATVARLRLVRAGQETQN